MSDQQPRHQEGMQTRVASHGNTETVHNPEPDYHRPLLEIPPEARQRMFEEAGFPLRGSDGKGLASGTGTDPEGVLRPQAEKTP